MTDKTFEFEDDDVLTSSEVRRLINAGLAKGEDVILQIGDKRRVISWIGEQYMEDLLPTSPHWRIELKK